MTITDLQHSLQRSSRAWGRHAGRAGWLSLLTSLALAISFSLLSSQVCSADGLTIDPVEKPVQFPWPQPRPQLVESTSLIQAGILRATYGVDGTGLTVAVLDTGLRTTHLDFAGKVVAQRNYTADNAGDVNNATDGHGHGTNVGGIIVANANHTGIAPGANIIPLKVLSNTGSGQFTWTENALQWVLDNHDTYNITVVNLSLGSANNFLTMPDEGGLTIRAKIQALRAAKVAVVIAAGNGFYGASSLQGMAYPAIVPECVSVGAVYDANAGSFNYTSGAIAYTTGPDRITPFSQRLGEAAGGIYRTDIFAPGAALTSSGNATDIGESVMHGTSQATPVTCGVVLLLQQLYLNRTGTLPTIDKLESLLRATAVTINDGDDEDDNVTNTGLNFPRADALAAGLADAHDLVIDSVTPTKTSPAVDEAISVSVVVRNAGVSNAGPFQVGLHRDRASAPTAGTPPNYIENVAGLASGASTTVTFTGVSYALPGPKTLWAFADQADSVIEDNEANNHGPAAGRAMNVLAVSALVAGDAAAQYSDNATLTATLSSGGVGVGGLTVTFYVGPAVAGTGVTGPDGVATLTYPVLLAAGDYAVRAEFAGDGSYTPAASPDQTLTVTQEGTFLGYTGQTTMPTGSPSTIALSATVTQESDGGAGNIDLAGSVLFTILRQSDGTTVDTRTADIQPDGTAAATSAALPNVAYAIGVALVPNGYFTGTPTGAPVKGTPTLALQDSGAPVGQNATLTATLTSGGSPLPGTTVVFTVDGTDVGSAVTDAAGAASLTYAHGKGVGVYPLAARFAASAFYLAAGDGDNTLTVNAGPPAQLAFVVQPSSTLLMHAIAPAIQVVVRDAYGNTVTNATNPVTITIGTNPTHALLYGTATAVPVNGVATFANLRLSRVGKGYRLAASSGGPAGALSAPLSPGLTGALSAPFDVVSGRPERLAFLVEPTNGVVGSPLSPAVQVVFLNGLGQVVPNVTTPVSVTLHANPTRARIAGTRTVAPVLGTATFADLRLDRAGKGYTLKATAARVSGATSAAFSVAP